MKIVTQDFTAEMLRSSDASLFVQHLLCKLNGTLKSVWWHHCQ